MSKWIKKIDSQGNEILINPKVVYVLKEAFDVDEHLAYLYKINTEIKLESA